jgi:8-oxo-dGTP pyrophosphatase MutT (NUDIX family)
MEYEKSYRRRMLCSNCGKPGHEFKYCTEPITSFGIINIKILDDVNESLLIREKFRNKKNTFSKISSKKYPLVKCYLNNNIKLFDDGINSYKLDNEFFPYNSELHLQKFLYYRDKILFMMVSRRFSLGFIEFIRGKYDVSDTKMIISLFEQMTEEEIKFIQKNDYDDILYHFLNRYGESKEVVLNRIYEGKYSNEYCDAKIKFNILSNPSEICDGLDDTDFNNSYETNSVPLSLYFYTKHIRPRWKKPEWGFPKGRRDKKSEENLSCACREFEEETGYRKNDYTVLNKIEPIEEKLVGTNGVCYKHIYYLSMDEITDSHNINDFDSYEIGEIRWFTFDEAMSHIRPYHTEKKKILTRIYLFVLNYLIHHTPDLD